jgi:hypothetical protein
MLTTQQRLGHMGSYQMESRYQCQRPRIRAHGGTVDQVPSTFQERQRKQTWAQNRRRVKMIAGSLEAIHNLSLKTLLF